jgi:peptide/nickel transport system substrate-binding protein
MRFGLNARRQKRSPLLVVGLGCCILALLFGSGGCRRQDRNLPTATPIPAQPTATPTAEPPTEQQLTVLTQGTLSTLDPYLMIHVSPDESIAAHVWDTLVWLNDDLDLEPRLAESWRLINDLTWELDLRQGVQFHNGEPFSAEAVRFSLERTASLENSVETFANDVAFEYVEIIDDYTVRIHTAKPAVSMAYKLATVEMLPPLYYAETAPEDLANSPIGSGPYRLVSWDPGGRVVLEANTDYWQGAPAVHTLVFQAESDGDKRLARLADGEVDLVTDLSPDQAKTANTGRSRLEAIEGTRRLFVGLRYEEDTPLADRRVRQALNYAVDVEALVSEFHAGYGQRYGSWVNPPNANADLEPWPYDPEAAQELLVQAGYPQGFEIAMDTPAGRYYQDQQIAQAISAQLSQVGITVTVRSYNWPTYAQQRLIPKKTASLFLLSLMSRDDGLEDVRNLDYDFAYNPTLWYDQRFEDLLDRMEQTFNTALRTNLSHQAQAIAYEEAPWIWLWRPYLFYGVGQELDGWQPRADGLIYLYRSTLASAG